MANIEIEDSTLVKQYINGNENAIAILVKRHQSKIFNFIYSKVNNEENANDIFQDTFIKVIKTLKSDNYNEEGKFLPWVMRIAHNLVVDYFRKNKKMPMNRDTDTFSVFEWITDNAPSIENKIISEQINIDLIKLVEELPYEQKQVIEMRIFQDLSFKEISDIMGISINTALGRMRYALINIRKIIEKIMLF